MKKSEILLGFLAGAAAGALVGILLAPDEGSKTRKKLRQKGAHAMDDLKDKAYILAAYANEINNEVDRLTDKVEASIEQRARDAAGKISSKLADQKNKPLSA
jgi:gas vesicle protein